jgi:hypothetical protein
LVGELLFHEVSIPQNRKSVKELQP